MEDALRALVARVLGISADEIDDDLERNLEPWDSFNHLLLIHEIESELGVEFDVSDVEAIRTYGDLAKLVAARGGR